MESDAQTLFAALLVLQWIIFVWDTNLTYRQLSLHKKTEKIPENLDGIISEEDFVKARSYSIDKLSFAILRSIFEMIVTNIELILGFLPMLYYACEDWCPWASTSLFFLLHSLFSFFVDLPLSLYGTFVVEEKYGFNKYTLRFYIVDSLKKMALSYIILVPIVLGARWLIENTGPYFFLYLWWFASAVIFAALTIYPAFIAPLFDTYIPLPEGELKEAIENLASRLDYPLKKLYVVDGSKRSSHSNAYMYGFWKNKRIVLFDTLLNGEERVKVSRALAELEKKEGHQKKSEDDRLREEEVLASDPKGMSRQEVVAVLGHELGHWALSHTVQQLVIAELNIFFMFFIFSYIHGWPLLGEAFGFWKQPTATIISLMLVFQYVLGIFNEVMSVIIAFLTRRAEFQADAYAAKLGYTNELQKALVKLSKDNMSLPVDDPLYSMCKFSHPPVPERIAALKKFD